ncbi:MAG: aldehyde reductase [Myxococcales bacterium]|jgi:nucleoside-diphosphate-sugar epimerase
MHEDDANATVLVTGASGFIGLHCVLQLLQQGYRVRGSVRNQARADEVRETMEANAGVGLGDRLEIVEADLTRDEGWADAVRGCSYVLHVASPFPNRAPEHEDELIKPATEGTLRVLKAAAEAGVKRVVVTSSLAAVSGGHPVDNARVYTEDDWSIVERCPPYPKSKTLAERAAWDFVASLEGDASMELCVINPGAVLGPVLNRHYSTSGEIVRKLMAKELPGTAKLGFAWVDVRDVASAHIAAMTVPEAAGQRFCCAIEFSWIDEVADILARRFGPEGWKVPTRKLPNLVVRIIAMFDPTVKTVVSDLGRVRQVSSDRIRSVLNWQPHSLEEMTVSMGETMIEQGIVSR